MTMEERETPTGGACRVSGRGQTDDAKSLMELHFAELIKTGEVCESLR